MFLKSFSSVVSSPDFKKLHCQFSFVFLLQLTHEFLETQSPVEVPVHPLEKLLHLIPG